MVDRLRPIGTEGHPLGTDELGRDMLSRLIYGGRLTLFLGITPVIMAFAIGTALGLIAGYVGGWINTVVMRTADVFFAFPSVLLAIAISGALGAGIVNSLVSLTIVFIPPITRVAESVTASVRKLDYVDAARASGAGGVSIIRVHVLGNVMAPIFVYATSLTSVCMIISAGLSFLGLGVKPPEPEWGLMLNTLRTAIYVNPWIAALPGVMILITSLALNLLSDGLRSAMNVRQRPGHVGAGAPDIGGPAQPLIIAENLTCHFPVRAGALGPRRVVRAVDDVSFSIAKGETLGVAGESGCGKSTTARLLIGLVAATGGKIIYDGRELGAGLSLNELRRGVQMVFQDSFASLNPRLTIEETVAFGPPVNGVPRAEASAIARDLLDRVGLDPARFAGRYPHELSGGQRQRVNIGRALAMRPRLLILDEAVSALDKSVEARVLNLLDDLRRDFDLTYMFISHDLNVVRFISDRLMVMYLGEVVEVGPVDALYRRRAHPYTAALFSAMPSMDPDARTPEPPLAGDPPSPIEPPSGCRFQTRCPFVESVCASSKPKTVALDAEHQVACHMHDPASGHGKAAA